uniref:Uncharacterized protein n=1 Tax=Myotis myotis TaxID=51298 RepID=A0A7J7VYL9_MYOMY|nr:hypothetical protein mMyoMyo1_012199 [Myotis myotis]
MTSLPDPHACVHCPQGWTRAFPTHGCQCSRQTLGSGCWHVPPGHPPSPRSRPAAGTRYTGDRCVCAGDAGNALNTVSDHHRTASSAGPVRSLLSSGLPGRESPSRIRCVHPTLQLCAHHSPHHSKGRQVLTFLPNGVLAGLPQRSPKPRPHPQQVFLTVSRTAAPAAALLGLETRLLPVSAPQPPSL